MSGPGDWQHDDDALDGMIAALGTPPSAAPVTSAADILGRAAVLAPPVVGLTGWKLAAVLTLAVGGGFGGGLIVHEMHDDQSGGLADLAPAPRDRSADTGLGSGDSRAIPSLSRVADVAPAPSPAPTVAASDESLAHLSGQSPDAGKSPAIPLGPRRAPVLRRLDDGEVPEAPANPALLTTCPDGSAPPLDIEAIAAAIGAFPGIAERERANPPTLDSVARAPAADALAPTRSADPLAETRAGVGRGAKRTQGDADITLREDNEGVVGGNLLRGRVGGGLVLVPTVGSGLLVSLGGRTTPTDNKGWFAGLNADVGLVNTAVAAWSVGGDVEAGAALPLGPGELDLGWTGGLRAMLPSRRDALLSPPAEVKDGAHLIPGTGPRVAYSLGDAGANRLSVVLTGQFGPGETGPQPWLSLVVGTTFGGARNGEDKKDG